MAAVAKSVDAIAPIASNRKKQSLFDAFATNASTGYDDFATASMVKSILSYACTICAVLGLSAMPTKDEALKAEPSVRRLMEAEQAALASGKKTRSEVAYAALKLVQAADTEAAKLLLMKGAFILYVKDGNLEKAVATMNGVERTIADLPPQSVTNIIETALLGMANKKEVRERLFQKLQFQHPDGRVASMRRPPAVAATSSTSSDQRAVGLKSPHKDHTTIQSILDGMIKVPGRNYWLSATEVTQGQWESIMGYNLSKHKGANLPVENVSRDECAIFLEKLNASKEVLSTQFEFGLPTLDEWSYAAQAGGSDLDCWIKPGVVGSVLDMAWVKENSGGETHAVATKAPNAFGFYDMLGNVWEWMDCKEPNVGCRHGGSFRDPASDCTVRKGYHNPRNRRFDCYGFRLAAHIRSVAETWPDNF